MPHLLNSNPRIVVVGVGGAGGNAVNNMVAAGLTGVQFIVANTDTQALATSKVEHRIQLGGRLTQGLGAGSNPEIGEAAAEETIDEITTQIAGAHMVFIAAGMGGGTGTGAAYVIARAAKELEILTIAVVTKPFQFEGSQRMGNAEAGIAVLKQYVDTLLVIPNDNLFRVATDRTTFSEAFVLADQVLYSGIACLVDLIVDEGLINLDLADVKAVLGGMGTAMLGMGEASGEQRAIHAAEEAVVNPLLDDVTLKGARSLLLSITGGRDLTLWEVDEAANRIRQEVDPEANIIVGATLDENLGDKMRVAIVASGMPGPVPIQAGLQPDAPVWVPRPYGMPADGTSESYGRRLTEAITQRGPRGKARTTGKAGAKGRTAGGDGTRLQEVPPPLPEETATAPAKGSGGAKRRASGHGGRPKPTLQSVVSEARDRRVNAPAGAPLQGPGSGAGPVGWPEHWVKAGELADRAREPPRLAELVADPPAGRAQLPPRRASFFERLAGLVGTKRAG